MSVKTDVSFHLLPTEKGYTLTMGFPHLGTQKTIQFAVSQPPQKGATYDLYSQNGKVGEDKVLSFFDKRDVKEVKSALNLPLPKQDGSSQTLFVLDLKDKFGQYGDLESIRQS